MHSVSIHCSLNLSEQLESNCYVGDSGGLCSCSAQTVRWSLRPDVTCIDMSSSSTQSRVLTCHLRHSLVLNMALRV